MAKSLDPIRWPIATLLLPYYLTAKYMAPIAPSPIAHRLWPVTHRPGPNADVLGTVGAVKFGTMSAFTKAYGAGAH